MKWSRTLIKSQTVILIDAVSVTAVMHSVVTWSAEDVLERAEFGNQLSVDPELVQCVEIPVDHKLNGVHKK